MKYETRQLLGRLAALVVIVSLVYTGYSILDWFMPDDDVAVSINIEFGSPSQDANGNGTRGNDAGTPSPAVGAGATIPDGHARIRVGANHDGRQVKDATVHLRVVQLSPRRELAYTGKVKADQPFEQLVGLEDHDRFRVHAHVTTTPDEGASSATGAMEARWNIGYAPPTWIWWGLLFLGVGLGTWFLWSLTGVLSHHKNHMAICACYVLCSLFLVLPFLLSVLVAMDENLAEDMPSSPVGVLQVRKFEGIEVNHWAMNIGGVAEPASSEGDAESGAADTPATGDSANTEDTGDPGRRIQTYDIKGGLVIPLYVLILAMLGGAISMTRKLPQLQRLSPGGDKQAEPEEFASSFVRLWGGYEDPDEEQPEPLDGESPEDFKKRLAGWKRERTKKEKDRRRRARREEEREAQARSKALREYEAHTSSLRDARRDLIQEIMYLLTAPFLGILAYYLLFMIEGELAKQVPVVVIVTFTAGLTAETVLEQIKTIAGKMLAAVDIHKKPDQDDPTPPPTPAKAPAEESETKK